MIIYNSIEEFHSKSIDRTILTQGTFDGVHLGHRRILDRMNELAALNNAQSALLTFEPHPRLVIYGNTDGLQLLSTPEEKIKLLRQAGVKNLIIHPFTMDLAHLTPADYIHKILAAKLHARFVVTGHDHRFGNNRKGNINDLKQCGKSLGFTVEEIAPLQIENITVSSTKIREAISAGNMQLANALLGYNYSIHAKVVYGKQLGAALGYPTANLEIAVDIGRTESALNRKHIPADGIYAVHVRYEEKNYKGMMNIGNNPTIKNKGRSMEVHIFDFHSNIYNKLITVEFIKRIRDELKFDTLDELKNQLDKDKEAVLTVLK